MDWYDIDDILSDGTKEEIENLKCPVCQNSIYVRVNMEYRALEKRCEECGIIVKAHGLFEVPNVYTFFGEEFHSSPKAGEIA